MASRYSSHDLVDTMYILYPDAADIPSYARSAKRLDYALISSDLVDFIAGAGFNNYHEFYPSDHRPIFLGLTRRLFCPLPPLSSHLYRYVHSNSKMVSTFVTLTHRHLRDTNSFARLRALTSPESTKTSEEILILANYIDSQITRALLSAEKNCKKPKQEPWSEELHCASSHVKYWRLKCSATNNHYDASETLAAIGPLLPATYAIVDDGLRTDKQYLNAAKRILVIARRKLNAYGRNCYRN
jgi:hypothetical protein